MSWALNQLGAFDQLPCVHAEAEDSVLCCLFFRLIKILARSAIADGNGTLRQSDRRLLSCYNSGRVDVLLDFVRLVASSVVC